MLCSKGNYHGAKKSLGIRASVYRYAEQHQACYSQEHSKSIWYDSGSDDLQIALVFENKSLALKFRTFLAQFYLSSPAVKQGDITVQEVEVVHVHVADLKHVDFNKYDASESESPFQSLEEFSSVRSLQSSSLSVSSVASPLALFQSLEELNPNIRPYRCHIKPQSQFKNLKDNESNILACSWLFHQYLDGVNTEDSVSGESDVPLVAVKADPDEEPTDEMVGEPPQKRKRVSLLLECRSSTVDTSISSLLKFGSTRVNSTAWKTFVHVQDAKTFCDCLDWKYKHTHKKWESLDAAD